MKTGGKPERPGIAAGDAGSPGADGFGFLDRRPVLVALAGPNGAGKTTFYHAHLKPAGLRFLNGDEIARELGIDAYEAARVVTELRQELVKQRESFIFETVFSDPVGDKLGFLREAAQCGYSVALCFIVSQGGHDVAPEKLVSRFPRTLANLKRAIRELPDVLVFDNDDLRAAFRRVAVFDHGRLIWSATPAPKWLAGVMEA